MHVPDSLGRYFQWRCVLRVATLLFIPAFLWVSPAYRFLNLPSWPYFPSLAALLVLAGIIFVAFDHFLFRLCWRRKLIAGYIHRMNQYSFPRPDEGLKPQHYLWRVYRSASHWDTRLVAAEWLGVWEGFRLSGSYLRGRHQRAFCKALDFYRDQLDRSFDVFGEPSLKGAQPTTRPRVSASDSG